MEVQEMRKEKPFRWVRAWGVTGLGFGAFRGERMHCPHIHLSRIAAQRCMEALRGLYDDLEIEEIERKERTG
jgi:hypothetical protein